jgi:hypothetical protein
MRYLQLIAAVAFLLVGSPSVHAQTTHSRLTLARRLVEVLRYETQFAMFAETCKTDGGSPEAIVTKSPNFFGGIRPGDRRWNAVRAAYQTYMNEACARPTQQEFLGAISKTYAESLNDEQLKSAISFYETPVGRAVSKANIAAVHAVYDELARTRDEDLPASTVRFQAEVIRLLKEK